MDSNLDQIAGVLKDLAPLFTLVLGAWLGLRFNVLKDRRVERNEVVDRIRAKLLFILEHGGPTPMDALPNAVDLDMLQHMSSKAEWLKISALLTQYRKISSAYHQDSVGGVFFVPEQVEELTKIVQELLSRIARR